MNDIILPKKHFLFQTFLKKDLEVEFNNYFSKSMRLNHRLGIILSIVVWILALITLNITNPVMINEVLKFALLLIPIFLAVIITSFFDNKHWLSQILATLSNLFASLITIEISIFLVKSSLVFIIGIILILFFSSCILRIRFKLTFFLIVLEVILAQIFLYLFSYDAGFNLPILSVGIWISCFCSIFACYILESSDRKLFCLQRHLVELNNKLRQESFIDHLTQLYNRQFFFEALKAEIYTSERFKKPLSLAMLDIDHFKMVNDGLGHPVGDIVLMEFSQMLKECFRESDIIGRYGGEEFVIFFKETNLKQALISLKRFLHSVRTHQFTEVPWQITASCGLVQVTDEVESLDLIKKADDKLYKSKQNGRDKITI